MQELVRELLCQWQIVIFLSSFFLPG
jgi:hypothetical protein